MHTLICPPSSFVNLFPSTCYAGGRGRDGPGHPLHLIYPDSPRLEEVRHLPLRVVAKDQRAPEEDIDDVAPAADTHVPVCITNAGRVRRIITAVDIKDAPGQR